MDLLHTQFLVSTIHESYVFGRSFVGGGLYSALVDGKGISFDAPRDRNKLIYRRSCEKSSEAVMRWSKSAIVDLFFATAMKTI